MPHYLGPLFKASRLNICVAVYGAQLRIATPNNDKHKPCARADIRVIIHILLHKSYFTKMECEFDGYSAKISEYVIFECCLIHIKIIKKLSIVIVLCFKRHVEPLVSVVININFSSFLGWYCT